MKKVLLILILQNFAAGKVFCQSFTVDELISLAHMSSKKIGHYMHKKGFVLSGSTSDSGIMKAGFVQKIKWGKNSAVPQRSMDICIKADSKYITFHTSSIDEYLQGRQRLIKSGFFYDNRKDVSKEPSMLFQKANITIKTTSEVRDNITHYSFYLKELAIPSSLRFAEDLLQFDSHQFLVSYFGEQNVKKDMYYLSENELKKCSVLFSGTPRQVVFVWGDEIYLNNLLYIMVSNIPPTESAKSSNPLSQNNEWQLKNGIYAGMALKELLKINEVDFDIYGNKSELAFLVKPNEYGKIDFKKTAVMLSCHKCFENKIFDQKVVSALEIAKADLPMRIFDVVIYKTYR